MKHKSSTLLVCLLFGVTVLGLAQGNKSTNSSKALIKIDLDRTTGEIDRHIYGNFIEHLGRCIYGGIYDPGSPRADNDGFRKDVLDACRGLNVSILRWPGGNFASGYHWTDGIGPKEERPKRIDLAWGAIESNQFGTDEYIKFCRKLGTDPYICVNLGTGAWDEARNWVEYCNRKLGTYYSDLRAKNGSPEPYNVKYWALGNEMDGEWQMGHRSAEDYGKFALEAAKLMKWIDPEIRLVASGSSDFSGNWVEWNRTVLRYLKDYTDFIALHTYVGNRDNDYYRFLASTLDVEKRIKIVEGLINETMTMTRRKTPISIAFDEWNVWYRAWTKEGLEETYNLEDALVDAQFLNCFVRNAQIVKIANMAQLVNVIAPMRADKDGMWLQTIYYPLQLFATHCSGTSLDAFVSSATYETAGHDSVPYLDVSVGHDRATRSLAINVVNRHRDQALETEILSQSGRFANSATAYEVNGSDPKVQNSRTDQNVKTVQKDFTTGGGQRFVYRFPPHSFTMIKVKMQQ
jgi:alpha-N-arabinofuranosidase